MIILFVLFMWMNCMICVCCGDRRLFGGWWGSELVSVWKWVLWCVVVVDGSRLRVIGGM